jgi:hypothetical protein
MCKVYLGLPDPWILKEGFHKKKIEKGGKKRTEIFESQIFEAKSFFRSKEFWENNFFTGGGREDFS